MKFFKSRSKVFSPVTTLGISLGALVLLVSNGSLQTFRKNSSKFSTSFLSKQAQKVLRQTETRETSELLNKHFWFWFGKTVVSKYLKNPKTGDAYPQLEQKGDTLLKLQKNSKGDGVSDSMKKKLFETRPLLNELGDILKESGDLLKKTIAEREARKQKSL